MCCLTLDIDPSKPEHNLQSFSENLSNAIIWDDKAAAKPVSPSSDFWDSLPAQFSIALSNLEVDALASSQSEMFTVSSSI